MENLIVNDQEFTDYSTAIGYLTQSMEAYYSSIITQLITVRDTGVTEGGFHDNLNTYITALQGLQGQMQYITNAMQQAAEEFVKEIDVLDGKLY